MARGAPALRCQGEKSEREEREEGHHVVLDQVLDDGDRHEVSQWVVDPDTRKWNWWHHERAGEGEG
jgi:hypothetical protein